MGSRHHNLDTGGRGSTGHAKGSFQIGRSVVDARQNMAVRISSERAVLLGVQVNELRMFLFGGMRSAHSSANSAKCVRTDLFRHSRRRAEPVRVRPLEGDIKEPPGQEIDNAVQQKHQRHAHFQRTLRKHQKKRKRS